MVRVRIAPSPTGYLHVGTARTALFNYLFARKNNGKFILRIEDTDVQRSSQEMVDIIIDSISWLGLSWDEGPYFQSQRFDVYKKYAEMLLKSGKAYYCYCTKEEIEERKKKSIQKGKAWKYDRHCYYLTPEEKQRYEKEGRPKAIRFFVPEGVTSFIDLIHSEISRDNSDIEDFVILKSDGTASYNFAVVVDDHDMEISHVIRGDDHISNTFKQILVYNAIGWDTPEFGHLPLILGEDRSKLSKRHGAVAVSHYRDEGILPEAFVNFLALLGWSPGTEQEIFTMDELIRLFDLKGVGRKGAVFDIKKLLWMNGEYIKKMDRDELCTKIIPYLIKDNLVKKEQIESSDFREYLCKVVSLMLPRLNTLRDFAKIGQYFFSEDFEYDEKGLKKHKYEGLSDRLKDLNKKLEALDVFDEKACSALLYKMADEQGFKPGEIIHPVRLAISGMTFGPGLFELMEVLGKNKVIKRIERFVNFIEKGG